MSKSNAVPPAENGVLLITGDNLFSLEYTPEPGIRYEIAEGCIRTLKRPFYDVTLEASMLAKQEDPEQLDPSEKSYSPTIRLKVLEIITEGDPIPKNGKGVDNAVVGRAVVDFFTYQTIAPMKRLG